MSYPRLTLAALLLALTVTIAAAKDDVAPPVSQRFAIAEVQEEPDFQRHVIPLMGRLGCNGRACHGSFQGQGGFRLSLFGYDFKADHDALHDEDSPRVDAETPLDSLILIKPTDENNHEGGLRYEHGGWEYHVFRRWLEAGAKYDSPDKLVGLEVTPSEIVFGKKDETVDLQVVAVWEDGTREDVTPLCRFNSNDDQVAKVNIDGQLTASEPGDTHVVISYDKAVVPVPVMRPVSDLVGKKYPKVETPTKVDALVVDKLRKLGIVPSDLASDAEFLRRVSLDLTGSLPTAKQVEKFLADKSPNKRAEIVDELLETPAYTGWWTTKLCDFTGNNDFQLRNAIPQYNRNYAGASQQWYDWIYRRVEENVPYDELVAGIVTATSRKEGEDFTDYSARMSAYFSGESKGKYEDLDSLTHYWARQDLRDPEARAINFAYAFMGIRIQCAQCHKHPFDQWSKDDFAQFTNFFRQVSYTNGRPRDPEGRKEYDAIVKKLGIDMGQNGGQLRREFGRLMSEGKTVPFPEIVVSSRGNVGRNRNRNNNRGFEAKLLGGDSVSSAEHKDLRAPLMDWLREESNPYFARAFVNRVWATYFNVGIVNPPDDLSLANPPSNKPLLDYLTKGFVDSDFDMKWLHREIVNSRTYQLSWKPNETNAGDERNFSHAMPRRLPAEVTYDALLLATASDEKAAKLHQDNADRAIAIPGSNGQNRNNARTGPAYALRVFGRSIRESSCDCDRTEESSLLQTVFLQNDQAIHELIDRRNDSWMAQIAKELGVRHTGVATPNAPRRPANYEKLVADARTRIATLKKSDNKQAQQQIKKIKARLDQMLKRYGDPSPPADAEVAKVDATKYVEQAYLRTLSRYPSPEELDRSVKHIESSDSTLNGIRGLLWALLNTKEFIVNH